MRGLRRLSERCVRDEGGQILPVLVLILLSTLAFGVLVFQVGRAAVFRADAQTAADAAALAGVREVHAQLKRQLATTGFPDPTALDEGAIRGAAEEYAGRNGAQIVPGGFDLLGVDVRVKVRTKETLGEDAEPADREDARGFARARASLGLNPVAASLALGGGGALGSGVTGDTDISGKEWDELAEDVGRPPFDSSDIVKVGRFLERNGIDVSEHPAFGTVAPPPAHGQYGVNDHYNAGAIDVNMTSGDAAEPAVFDRVEPRLAELGFNVIWREPNHAPGDNSHMHVDIGPGGMGSGPRFGGAGGALGFPLGGDVVGEIRLVPWEGGPSLLGGLGGGGIPFGEPDLQIACKIYTYAQRRDLGPRLLLAAMEAAIVESGVHNLRWGDADSLGVFQQRPSVGEWGTAAQILDVDHAIMAFFRAAKRYDRGQPAAVLAQDTQRSAFPDRYGQVRGSAEDLIAKMEKGCDGGRYGGSD